MNLQRILGLQKLKFIPLFLLYVVIIAIGARDTFWHDEIRYVNFATNLSHGYYSPPGEINLKNGPGYPIILAPFALLSIPWKFARILNALFLWLALGYFFRTLKYYIPNRAAFIATTLFGLYPPFLRYLPLLITEILTVFLVCGFAYHFATAFREKAKSRFHWLVAAIYLTYLALTKVFFGYVIASLVFVFLILYLFAKSKQYRLSLSAYSLALLLCTPYLAYTFTLTGHFFYWGSVGGMSLYWMSSPYDGDLGDWHSADKVKKVPELSRHHGQFFRSLEALTQPEKDNAFKRQALHNIVSRPAKFVKNWIANLGRLFFNYPYSYTPQKLDTYVYFLPNAVLMVLLALSLYPGWRARRKIPDEILSMLLFAFIGLAGLSLLSAYARFLLPFIPILVLWLCYAGFNLVKIEVLA